MPNKDARKFALLLISAAFLAVVVFGALLLPQNLVYLDLLKGSFDHDRARLTHGKAVLALQNEDCSTRLTLAVVETRLEGIEQARPDWEGLLSCPEEYISFLKAVFSTDIGMAQKVLAAFPTVSTNYFWLAGLLRSKNPQQSIPLFQQGLQIDPLNGSSWCILGSVERKLKDLPAAAEAFSNCCQNGDPNDAGCYEAGNVYKSLGDLNRAAQFYLYSYDPTVQALGIELKKQILEGQK